MVRLLFSPHKGTRQRDMDQIFSQRIFPLSPGSEQANIRNQHYVFHSKRRSTIQKQKNNISKIVCDIRPNKAETHGTRITVGGNFLDYAGTLTTPTATITTAKCLFNSFVSTLEAKCVLADIKTFYLNNALPDPEYMKFHIATIPQ